jgi:hypothetical protein
MPFEKPGSDTKGIAARNWRLLLEQYEKSKRIDDRVLKMVEDGVVYGFNDGRHGARMHTG